MTSHRPICASEVKTNLEGESHAFEIRLGVFPAVPGFPDGLAGDPRLQLLLPLQLHLPPVDVVHELLLLPLLDRLAHGCAILGADLRMRSRGLSVTMATVLIEYVICHHGNGIDRWLTRQHVQRHCCGEQMVYGNHFHLVIIFLEFPKLLLCNCACSGHGHCHPGCLELVCVSGGPCLERSQLLKLMIFQPR